ncbi:MAG: hypothetical protein HXS54_17990 [Theionarchaea archaeon]|nr:hypothetical protein [Theionarchaea archaeon]
MIEGPFGLRKREKFIMEFEMIYRKPIVVFDTNIVENSKFEELKGFERKGKIKLGVPAKVLEELRAHPNKEKQKELLGRIGEIRKIPDLFQFSGGGASFSMKFRDQKDKKRFERVLSIIYQMSLKKFQNDRKRKPETTVGIERDVKNVESAIRFHADFFVTNDGKHILSRKDDIEEEFGVKVLKLNDMIQYLSS